MKILLSTVGTLGDLFPLLALARALRDQGVTVIFGAQADHRARIQAAGFDSVEIMGALADAAEGLGLSESEIVRKAMIDSDFLFREVLPYDLVNATRRLIDFAQGVDLVACTMTAEAAKLTAEHLGVPCVPLVLQPLSALLVEDPPFVPDTPVFWRNPGAIGRVWNRFGVTMAHAGLRQKYAKILNPLRAELGLGAQNAPPFLSFPVRPPLRLALYSAVLHDGYLPDGASLGDPALHFTGFCRHASPETLTPETLTPETEAFLAAGSAPIVFTMGSMAAHIASDFFAHSVTAARALGRRAILLTGEGAKLLPPADDILQLDWAPHAHLFPRSAAVVHHGGVGSMGEALFAGKPQLVVPVGSDQPDNALRMERLGVGRRLPAKRYRADRATALLQALLDGDAGTVAGRLALRVAAEPGADGAAQRLMALYPHAQTQIQG